MRPVTHLCAAAVAVIVALCGCNLPTSSDDDNNETGTSGVVAEIKGTWDLVTDDLVTSYNGHYWVIDNDSITACFEGGSPDPYRLHPIYMSLAYTTWEMFANNGNIGSITRTTIGTTTETTWDYDYDYTLKDSLGATYLLIRQSCPTGTSAGCSADDATSPPITFADFLACYALYENTNLILCMKKR